MKSRMRPVAVAAGLMVWPLMAFPATPLKPLLVDGRFDDWDDSTLLLNAETDAVASEAGPPVTRMGIASDRDRLFLRFALPREVVLQRNSNLVLYVDTDASAASGLPVEGLGAELRWAFSERAGRVITMGLPIEVSPAAIGLRQAPTLSASEFEIALDRRARVAGAPIFSGDRVVVLLRDESHAPTRSTGPLTVFLADTEPPVATGLSLARRDPAHLRILSYNVLFDGCFERPEPFGRIFRTLAPDIVSLQEIYTHSAEETRDLFARVFPGEQWHAAGGGQGIILSRYPIRDSGPLGSRGRGGWALVETPIGDVLVINPHPPCCDDDAGRQKEFDAIAGWLRDTGTFGSVPRGTPIVIAGDMNLVGEARQLRTLLEGVIVDTASYGASHPADGDGTALTDAMPYHLSGREVYTWRNDQGPFPPGRLDYLIYSDSVLGLGRRFVLWTPDLPEAFLKAEGLRPDDTAVASDHLPVVGDFYRLAPSSR